MNDYRQVLASEVGVKPAFVDKQKNFGMNYFVWPQDYLVGAQCKNCNVIVWLDPTSNKILSEPKPNEVPASGNSYRSYYEEKISRFLASLPSCPGCGQNVYDRFVNNTSYPRFSDGTEVAEAAGLSLSEVDPSKVYVWWLDGS